MPWLAQLVGSKTHGFPLEAGQSSASLLMGGLPLGDDTFGAEAFEIDCKSVAAASVAEWIGEVAASVVKDQVTDVTISMKRNGQGAVSLDFPDEPGCSAPGVACLHGAECCSGTCNNGTCAVANCTSYAYTGNPFVVGTGNVTAQVVFDATPTPGFTGVLGIEHVVSWHIASSPIDVSSATPAQEPDATGFFPLQFAFDNGVIESWQFAQVDGPPGQAGYKIYTLKDSTTLNGKTEDGAQDAKQVNRYVTSNAGSWAPACN